MVYCTFLGVDQAFSGVRATVSIRSDLEEVTEADIAKVGAHEGQHARLLEADHEDRRRRVSRIISDLPLIVPIDELAPAAVDRNALQSELHEIIRSYRRTLETDRRHLLEQFRFVDLARKVVGVGSVGTPGPGSRCYWESMTTIPCSYQLNEAPAGP